MSEFHFVVISTKGVRSLAAVNQSYSFQVKGLLIYSDEDPCQRSSNVTYVLILHQDFKYTIPDYDSNKNRGHCLKYLIFKESRLYQILSHLTQQLHMESANALADPWTEYVVGTLKTDELQASLELEHVFLKW